MFKTPKQQVAFIGISCLVAAFSLASIIKFSDPNYASVLTFIFLYLSLFLFSLGAFSVIGLGIRQWLWPGKYVINLSNSFRQALLLSILVLATALLLANGLLFWWVEASLILFLVFVEAFLNLKI